MNSVQYITIQEVFLADRRAYRRRFPYSNTQKIRQATRDDCPASLPVRPKLNGNPDTD